MTFSQMTYIFLLLIFRTIVLLSLVCRTVEHAFWRKLVFWLRRESKEHARTEGYLRESRLRGRPD